MDKKDNPHKGHRERMMNRLSKNGGHTMEDHELLEMMLYQCYKTKNTNDIAHALLNQFGNIYKVCHASVEDLIKVEGVGLATAKYLTMFPEFFSAYSKSRTDPDFSYDTVEMIADYCIDLVSKNQNEQLYILCFNAGHKLIKVEKLSEGIPDSVFTEPRKVVGTVVNTSAVEVALCHNHPGGNLKPSQNDISYTCEIKRILKSIDIELKCHIIVANGKYIQI